VTLSLMVALGREEEFKLHVRPALRNGVTPDKLRALLIQCAVYAGVPASNGAFPLGAQGAGSRSGRLTGISQRMPGGRATGAVEVVLPRWTVWPLIPASL